MALLFLGYLLVAVYNLGSFNVPVTVWKPVNGGEMFDIDLGREVDVARIYYYSGINESRYDNAKFFVLYQKGGQFHSLTAIDKNECGIWKYKEVSAKTSRLKIVANPPGGALNEMAIVEKGKRVPYTPVRLQAGSSLSDPKKLFDEQDTFEYAPSFKSSFYFDEIYHARTAYEQLQRMDQYENTHPPLGKLFIAAGIALFGMNSFGWRIAGTLFGAAMVPAMYLFGKKLFGSRFFAFCAAFLMMVDFMHFTQTRIAVIDVYGTFFIILMFYFMHDFYNGDSDLLDPVRSLRPLFLSGLCFGLGAACKWISLYAGAGLAFLVLLKMYYHYRENATGQSKAEYLRLNLLPLICFCLLFFVVIPSVVYLLSYIPFLLIKGQNHGLIDILKNQRDMFVYHSQLKATHPFSSPWWSWPLDLRPIWLYTGSDLPAGQVSSIASFGNPAIWWAGIPAVLAAVIMAGVKRDRRMAVVFTGLACQYLPWATIPRVAFIYHFFSVVPFMILSLVYVMKATMERWPQARHAAYAYLCLAGGLFILFYPVLSGLQLAEGYFKSLRWLKSWTF
ncbi:phospholipid carrier-dependent glycosyltransferase [Pelotalea chapellei]|uniref:Polyprenol-phosphate-mannose--protein mannosyltransferase n=1 Tax=Pelotalea chapellei TaxID=44671 RepID=A0ABS5U939_9BACT|nr:phospholipid carrier-dependent glycosyltransferase [Pelotalea chapellei]MBT1072178.1 phospholipid carrier-dependent glycosyltransferase [Pelotalea chapellei]